MDHSDYSLSISLGFWINRIAKAMEADFDQAAAPLRLTAKHWGIMMTIGEHGAVSQVQIARQLGVDPAGITRLAEKLEQRGLLVRSQDDQDRRNIVVRLSSEGEAALRALIDVSQTVNARWLAKLPPTEQAPFMAALQRVAADHPAPDA